MFRILSVLVKQSCDLCPVREVVTIHKNKTGLCKIKTGLCKIRTGLWKIETGLWPSWAIVLFHFENYFSTNTRDTNCIWRWQTIKRLNSDKMILPLHQLKNKRDKLTTQQACILWGTRVVVPSSLQKKVLQELHDTHPEISRMKALAWSYIWWPNIDSHIERTVSCCNTCQSTRSALPTAQIYPWIFPARPWSHIHVDFAGPFSGCRYMFVVDAFSKFPEAVKITNTTAHATITEWRYIFSRHGLPEILVSYNGAQLTSRDSRQFCSSNGILHRTSGAYKPSTIGQAEHVVQILKPAIKQAQLTNRCGCCNCKVPIGLWKHPTLYYRGSSLSTVDGTEATYSHIFTNPFSWKACLVSTVLWWSALQREACAGSMQGKWFWYVIMVEGRRGYLELSLKSMVHGITWLRCLVIFRNDMRTNRFVDL